MFRVLRLSKKSFTQGFSSLLRVLLILEIIDTIVAKLFADTKGIGKNIGIHFSIFDYWPNNFRNRRIFD